MGLVYAQVPSSFWESSIYIEGDSLPIETLQDFHNPIFTSFMGESYFQSCYSSKENIILCWYCQNPDGTRFRTDFIFLYSKGKAYLTEIKVYDKTEKLLQSISTPDEKVMMLMLYLHSLKR